MKRALIYAILFILVLGGTYLRQQRLSLPQVKPQKREARRAIEKDPSPETLAQLVEQCNSGDAEICMAVGYSKLKGASGERDSSVAKEYFEKACDLAADEKTKELQCESIARIFERGEDVRADRAVAEEFHKKAREARLKQGQTFGTSDKERDRDGARCDDGDTAECFRSAEAYLKESDTAKGEFFLQKSCSGKTSDDLTSNEEYPGKICGLVAELYEDGNRGIGRDLKKAGDYYTLACDLAQSSSPKNGFACDLAGAFFRDKKNDPRLAGRFFTKGCDLGDTGACEHFEKLNLPRDVTF